MFAGLWNQHSLLIQVEAFRRAIYSIILKSEYFFKEEEESVILAEQRLFPLGNLKL